MTKPDTQPNTDPDRQIRPFSDFLLEISNGQSHHELSEALNELVQAVALIGKSGTLTYVLKVAPAGRNAEATVMITDDIKLKAPEGDRPDSVFFVDKDGNLSRHNPAQIRMPLREVPGGVIVDPDTGEIGDTANA